MSFAQLEQWVRLEIVACPLVRGQLVVGEIDDPRIGVEPDTAYAPCSLDLGFSDAVDLSQTLVERRCRDAPAAGILLRVPEPERLEQRLARIPTGRVVVGVIV